MITPSRVLVLVTFIILRSVSAGDTEVVPYRLMERAMNIADWKATDTLSRIDICRRYLAGYQERLLFPTETLKEATADDLVAASPGDAYYVAQEMGRRDGNEKRFTLEDFGWHAARNVQGTLRFDAQGRQLELQAANGERYAIDARQIVKKLASYALLARHEVQSIECTLSGFVTPKDTELFNIPTGYQRSFAVETIVTNGPVRRDPTMVLKNAVRDLVPFLSPGTID
jgi:hypothetical protein